MFDYVTVGSLAGLVIFGYLWKIASPRALYMDSDNDPVSWKSICGYLWLMSLVVLIAYQFSDK